MDVSLPPALVVSALEGASEEQLIAVMEVMHFVAKADGFLSADELRQFLKLSKALSDTKIDSKTLSELVSAWGKREVDTRARLTELTAILATPEIRRAAYELAEKMATADGTLEGKEMGVLELIEEVLDL
jgi:uncharacterized tellurite resistance protein B-like protein